MPLLSLVNVHKAYGAQVVLRDVTFELHDGERVGVIGANGSGKTTILKLITGEEEPDQGSVVAARDRTVGYLPQEPQLAPGATLLAETLRAFDDLRELEASVQQLGDTIAQTADPSARESALRRLGEMQQRFEASGGYTYEAETRAALCGLGLPESQFDTLVDNLSGGQRSRASMAKLLLRKPDVLLLDEPTNHLDLPAVEWLERFLAKYPGAVMVISHDRYLLDRVVGRVLELERCRIAVYQGNYTEYRRQKGLRLLEQQRIYERQQTHIEKERSYIRRYAAGQRAREARGRRTRLERFMRTELIEKPVVERPAGRLRIEPKRASGHLVLSARNLSKRFETAALFDDLSFEITRGERVGVVGPNGSGKTTLLRMIMDEMAPDTGELKRGAGVEIGYHEQDMRGLDLSKRVIDEVWSVRPTVTENEVRSFLGRFLFSGDDVFKTVGDLSGGEQARVKLATLLFSRPNFLVLDEPTNHLDIASRCALEEALEDYEGTLLVVSHDRYLLNRLVKKLLVIEAGEVTRHWGSYSDYCERREARAAQSRPKAEKRQPKRPSRKPKAKEEADPRVRECERKLRALALDAVEDLVEKQEAEIAQLEETFASPDVYKDEDGYRSLKDKYDEAKEELELLLCVWERRAGR